MNRVESAPFNPYGQWLGIDDAGGPPDHYRLFGLAPLDEDPARIAQAASATEARLRSIEPGQNAEAWQQTLDEVAIARLCLLNPARKAQYDAQLRVRMPAGQPNGGAREFPAQAVVAVPVYAPVQPVPAAPAAALENDALLARPAAFLDLSRAPDDGVPPSPAARTSRTLSCGVSTGAAAIGVVVALGIGFAIGRATSRLGSDDASPLQSARADSTGGAQPSDANPPASGAPTEQRPKNDQSAAAEAKLAATPRPKRTLPKASSPSPNSKPQPDDGSLVTLPPEQTKPSPAAKPNPPAEQPPAKLDPKQTAAFYQSLKTARTLMGERDLARAKAEMSAAEKLVASEDQQADFDRMKLLYEYVEGFWQAVGKSLSGLQPADELVIGSTRVAVVSASSDSLTIRMEGGNKEYKRMRMPAGLASYLAARWYDAKNPANKLYLGAFQAVDPAGSIGEAKRLWREAGAGGAPAEELMPLLADAASRPIGVAGTVAAAGPDRTTAAKLAVPDKAKLDAAARAIRAKFDRDFRSARFAPQRAELAKKLLDASAGAEDAAQRYVMLRDAVQLFRDGNDPRGLIQASDEMARFFTVDALAMKADALALISAAINNSAVAKDTAQAALDVADQAAAAGKAEPLTKLLEAARVAAAKSRDAELAKQVRERKEQLQAPPKR